MALLKGGCTQLMLLRAVMSFDPDNNSWRIPYSRLNHLLPMDVLKSAGEETDGILYKGLTVGEAQVWF